eukprot:1901097-Ditylum_brightwellii.AAC.1
MNKACNIIKQPMKPTQTPPSADTTPGPLYFAMLCSLLYKKNGQPPDPNNPTTHSYFAVLISFLIPSPLHEDPKPLSFLDTP